MENQSNHRVSNFWFGFLLGTAVSISAAYFFGTKKGRKNLQKLIELSENLEENIFFIVEELGDELKEKAKEIYDEIDKPQKKDSSLSIGSILSKIKTLSPQSLNNKKRFFVKK